MKSELKAIGKRQQSKTTQSVNPQKKKVTQDDKTAFVSKTEKSTKDFEINFSKKPKKNDNGSKNQPNQEHMPEQEVKAIFKPVGQLQGPVDVYISKKYEQKQKEETPEDNQQIIPLQKAKKIRKKYCRQADKRIDPTQGKKHRRLNYNNHQSQYNLSEKQQKKKEHNNKTKSTETQSVNSSDEAKKSQAVSTNQFQIVSDQLLETFKRLYPYYLKHNAVHFPIQDSLFDKYTQLMPKINVNSQENSFFIDSLWPTFSQQLQIWNIIVQHQDFFKTKLHTSLKDVSNILRDINSNQFKKLFIDFHNFYLSDLLLHKYDDYSHQSFFSFISLWKYADQNAFLDKIFKTFWNKFVLLNINIFKKVSYYQKQSNFQLEYVENYLNAQIEKGTFDIPKKYEDLLEYIVVLINMSFDTYTFKSLINHKMELFRENNKTKNDFIQRKKLLENELCELKALHRAHMKQEKIIQKLFKKNQKVNDQENFNKLQNQQRSIWSQLEKIDEKRKEMCLSIAQVDKKIEEINCIPEFSNVWLLGQDRDLNIYWFIKENPSRVYKQNKQNGVWSYIQFENIEPFLESLNNRGLRERKLQEKIRYYREIGYIKHPDQVQVHQNVNQNEQPAKQTTDMPLQAQKMQIQENKIVYAYDTNDFQNFVFSQCQQRTPQLLRLMILKSQWMMTKYLYERTSKWTTDQCRHQYIKTIQTCDLQDYDNLTQMLRTFNEKICVVQIIIPPQQQEQKNQSRTRKIQTKIWGINEKYKHFWYDYSRRCHSQSDLHFLVSILYLTIQKYVTKTRKPTNTKYFYKTVEFQEQNELNQSNIQHKRQKSDNQSIRKYDKEDLFKDNEANELDEIDAMINI